MTPCFWPLPALRRLAQTASRLCHSGQNACFLVPQPHICEAKAGIPASQRVLAFNGENVHKDSHSWFLSFVWGVGPLATSWALSPYLAQACGTCPGVPGPTQVLSDPCWPVNITWVPHCPILGKGRLCRLCSLLPVGPPGGLGPLQVPLVSIPAPSSVVLIEH